MKKRMFFICLAMTLAVTGVTAAGVQTAYATTLSKAREQKSQAQSNLNNVTDQIDQLKSQQASLQAQINEVDADLVQVLVDLDVISGEIEDKKIELAQAESDLEDAKEKEAEQYESMKQRIRYMYENGSSSYLDAFVGADSFADILNRVENFSKVYDYDRNLLVEYQNTKAEVERLIEQVQEEKEELEENQSSYQQQQKKLEEIKKTKSSQMSNFNSELTKAQSLASEYKKTIDQQNQIITQELEAAKQVRVTAGVSTVAKTPGTQSSTQKNTSTKNSNKGSSSSESKNNNSENNTSNKNNSSNSGDSANNGSNSGNASSGSSNKGNSSGNNSGGNSSENTDSGNGNSSSSNGTGSAVVSFACQFVGNPYVWGGESLTNGADCSGFIKSVYAHFGVSLPHSSESLRSVGRGVSALEMQPGDIICYAGHVAIYIGNNQIVHASSPTSGIKISSNPYYKTILAVRRIF